ncbi:hypothetical protein F53441_7702 [Fusarium austroafricanum]|uniref:AB hydrolase-1 domain-containing protein n=1 Tax=Fusarium austroafricanum TaxID=2364996 RepID=A0A8H4KGN3_9HYPO|nr:hypothetical protein F53441_7702 [Fusarium austroafricanum]
MSPSAPAIVIVPGAFLGTRPYEDFAKMLRAKGYMVDVVSLPSAGDLTSEAVSSPAWKNLASKTVYSDVEAIYNTMKPHFQQGRDVVLMGHSYGSMPAILSIEGHTTPGTKEKGGKGGVVGFINIAGFAFAARGKNAMGTDDDPPVMPYHKFEVLTPPLFARKTTNPSQDGIVTLQETARPLFFSDLSPERQEEIWQTFPKQQSWACFLCRPNFIDADVQVPKAYVKTELDQCVFPAWQDGFVAAGQYDKTISMSTGHCPMVSAPEALAREVDKFISETCSDNE